MHRSRRLPALERCADRAEKKTNNNNNNITTKIHTFSNNTLIINGSRLPRHTYSATVSCICISGPPSTQKYFNAQIEASTRSTNKSFKKLVADKLATPEQIYETICNQTVDLVFTAHPTQVDTGSGKDSIYTIWLAASAFLCTFCEQGSCCSLGPSAAAGI